MAKKQAVVLIHGVGEQVPMETLRSFVDAVWISDDSIRRPNVPSTAWSKPDEISGSFELRRLTTAENREGRRTDFFEFYWAHLMDGTQLGHVRAWLKVLLFRSPSRVLPQFRGIWWAIAGLLFTALAVAVWHYFVSPIPENVLKFGGGLWFLLGSTLVWFLIHYAGDAARYLHVAPPNIKSRHQIREAGVDLLEKLHASNKYDRIILVGHSLGSVIGYDILTHLWTRYHDKHWPRRDVHGTSALEKSEEFARKFPYSPVNVAEYQNLQADFLKEIQAQESHWLVSDFVTLGSPLAHAEMLLARCEQEFERKKVQREFPTCPPEFEEVDGVKRFSFPAGSKRIPHHAAVFSVTRWTNLYFPCHHTLWGDVIGGPLEHVFGRGVLDVPVETDLNNGFFTHTLYWKLPKDGTIPQNIIKLREAVRICTTQHVARAKVADAPEVFALIQRCRDHLEEQAIFQWYDAYPGLTDVEKDVSDGSLFVIRSGAKIVAAACLNDDQPDEYAGVPWTISGKAFVVHRLCVDPDHEGTGLGRALMQYAEKLGRTKGFSCIRLDSYTGNPRSAEFYQKLGYSVAGQVFFPGRELPFNCLEKQLIA